jgi:hypothetical protein
MRKRIGILLICILFIVVSFVPIISGYNFIDELDQQQLEFLPYNEDQPMGYVVYTDLIGNESMILAQSFKPNLPILTRVQLWFTQGIEPMNCDLIISIRDSLNGSDLTMIPLPPNEIPMLPNYSWINCDFPDIFVNIGQTYYIVAQSYCGQYGSSIRVYAWAFGVNTSYDRGMFHRHFNNTWEIQDYRDLCFKTYGLVDSEDMIKIESLSGGFGFSAVIKNNGSSYIYNVNWSIDVEPSIGLILSGSHTENVIDELETGESIKIQSNGLLGVGLITITVQAADAEKQATAFLLGPLVLRVNEL